MGTLSRCLRGGALRGEGSEPVFSGWGHCGVGTLRNVLTDRLWAIMFETSECHVETVL